MKISRLFIFMAAGFAAVLATAETKPASVLKEIKDRGERGTLSDQRQLVRGDTGKWNDAAKLLHAPSPAQKPKDVSLDDWIDEMAGKEPAITVSDENWLLFRTRQLDDNDRTWIEKIERRGNEFIITMHEAIWQGNYFKTFTYYEVDAVNLGKLAPGDYTVKWVVKPLGFKQLEKPREAISDYKTNWPTDDQPGNGRPLEVKTTFSVKHSTR